MPDQNKEKEGPRSPLLVLPLLSGDVSNGAKERERGGGGERERERKVGRKTTRYTHVHTPIHPSCSRRIISFDIDRVIDLESVRSFIPWIYRNTSSNERWSGTRRGEKWEGAGSMILSRSLTGPGIGRILVEHELLETRLAKKCQGRR